MLRERDLDQMCGHVAAVGRCGRIAGGMTARLAELGDEAVEILSEEIDRFVVVAVQRGGGRGSQYVESVRGGGGIRPPADRLRLRRDDPKGDAAEGAEPGAGGEG